MSARLNCRSEKGGRVAGQAKFEISPADLSRRKLFVILTVPKVMYVDQHERETFMVSRVTRARLDERLTPTMEVARV